MDSDGHMYIHKAVLLGHVDAVDTLLTIEGMAHAQDQGGNVPLEVSFDLFLKYSSILYLFSWLHMLELRK